MCPHSIVIIDRELSLPEQECIQSFADTWHMKIDWNEHSNLAADEPPVSFVKTHDDVAANGDFYCAKTITYIKF